MDSELGALGPEARPGPEARQGGPGTVEDLSAVVDRLLDADDASGPDAGELVALHVQCRRLEALLARRTAAFDASQEWALDGARSVSGWLAKQTHEPKGVCARRARLGRSVRQLPATEEAWVAGEISSAHVATLVGLRNDRTAEALARDEEMLVGYARDLRFDQFEKASTYWSHLADPDGAEQSDEERRNRRDAYLVSSIGGMYLGKMTLDPISGSVVAKEMARLEKELFEAEWAAAKDALGRTPTKDDLDRTASQRRADALVAMAARSAAAAPDARIPAPLFTVVVDYPTLIGRVCELANGSVVAPGALLPWLDRALVERVVFGAKARIEVSEKARLFTGATRRAIEVRDQECFHPLCDAPASRCQVDHIVPYEAGGPTTQENGRLACPFHTRARHRRPPPAGGSSPPDDP
jgi:hypothetical protein